MEFGKLAAATKLFGGDVLFSVTTADALHADGQGGLRSFDGSRIGHRLEKTRAVGRRAIRAAERGLVLREIRKAEGLVEGHDAV